MRRGLIALVAAAALASCTGTGKAPEPAAAGSCVESAPVASGSAGSPLADVGLACLSGGAGQVRLARLGRPAVVNVWASWCTPCRRELPELQSFAQRAGGAVLVVGVAHRDGRNAARSFAEEFGVTVPMLYDPDGELLLAVERTVLPVTLFLDAQGRVAHVYNSTPLDEPGFARLVAEHLAVELP